MPEHVYDDEEVPLSARVSGSDELLTQIKTLDFVVTEIKKTSTAALDPITVDLVGNAAKHNYTPSAVPDDHDSYDFTYVAKITLPNKSTRTQEGRPEVHRVWPAQVELTFTSEDDSHATAQFRVLCLDELSSVKTATDGKWTGQVGKGSFEIRAEPPYALVEPEHQGRKRTYQVKKSPYKVEFVEPAVADPGGTTKQYVNLETPLTGWSTDAPFGHQLSFVVAAEGDSKRDNADRHGKQGDIVYIEVEFTPATKRNEPLPKLLDDGLEGKATEVEAGKKYTGQIKLGANAQATFKVELGHAGGDICKVKVGADDSCADASLGFETWRRLEYELMYPDFMAPELSDGGGGEYDVPAAMRNAVVTRLGAAFIEYVRVKSHSFTRDDAPDEAIRTAAFIGQPASERDRYVVGGSFGDDPPGTFLPAHDRKVQILLVDRAYSTDSSRTSQNLFQTQLTERFLALGYLLPLEPIGAAWKADIAHPEDYMAAPVPQWATVNRPISDINGYTAELTELNQDKSEVVTFAEDSTSPDGYALELSDDDQDTLGDWFEENLSDVETLDIHGGVLRFRVGLPRSDDPAEQARHDQRYNHLQSIIRTKITDIALEVSSHPGVDPYGSCREGELDAGCFQQLQDVIYSVTLPTRNPDEAPKPGDFVGPAETPTQCRINLTFDLWLFHAINGSNSSVNQTLVFTPPPRTKGALASTMCHELGHAMGMTIMPDRSKHPPGTDAAKHVDNGGVYYLNGTGGAGLRDLGKGSHCATGVTTNLSDPKFEGGSGTCIMFHSGGDADSRQSFCDVCAGYLKARKLTDLRSSWKDRNDEDY